MNEMPAYSKHLTRHTYSYDDPIKVYVKQILLKIPYFGPDYLNKHLFHKILYNLELKYYKGNHLLLKEDDECKLIYIVLSGSLEVYTELEGNEFVLEQLMPGSILNHRVIFTDDTMQVNIRTIGNTQLLELSQANLVEILGSDCNF
jgi:CRP-like cAMP-binding protein